MLSKDHATQIKYIEYLIRSLADEEIMFIWFSVGIPDGDINEDTTIEEIQERYSEEEYEEWQKLFCKIMSIAHEDGSCLC